MANNNSERDVVVGIPFWMLFAVVLPGFAGLYLFGLLLEAAQIMQVPWKERSEVEKIVFGILAGFVLYTIPLGLYVKKYVPIFKHCMDPLLALITGVESGLDTTLTFQDRMPTLDDAYVFHNEFVARLRSRGIYILNRPYGFFLFAVFLASILLVYLLIRILIVAISNRMYFSRYEMLKEIGTLIVILWLCYDARISFREYVREICRLATIHQDIVRDTVAYIKTFGAKYIRPSPAIDYP